MKAQLLLLICLLTFVKGINATNLNIVLTNDTLKSDSLQTIETGNFATSDSINVFLLRGLTRESGHWGQPFLDALKQQIPNARIFLLDLPGSGKYVNEDASFHIKEMVDFMKKEVDSINLKYAGDNLICATSLGGMLATEWVISYPNDFQGLVFIAASFKGICDLNERVQKSVRKDMFKVMFSKNIEEKEKLIVRINSNHPENYDSISKVWIQVQNERPMTKKNIFKQAIAGMLYSTNGKKPEVPLLIVGSEGDRMVCATCTEKIHTEFGGTKVMHPTSGHGLPIDEPMWLANQISIWINSTYQLESLAKK